MISVGQIRVLDKSCDLLLIMASLTVVVQSKNRETMLDSLFVPLASLDQICKLLQTV